MRTHVVHTLALASLGLLALPVHAADGFAPVGAKATLSVDYLYECTARKYDKYDLHEWTVNRARRAV